MAGVSTTNSSNSADADGVTTLFNFTFFVYSTDDIKVYSVLDDVLTPITTGITKTINSSFIGGTVLFSVAPADAVGEILIRREVPYTQETELADITRYKETAIEAALNAIVLQVQQLAEAGARALKYNETSGITDPTIEEPADSSVLVFDGITGRVKAGILSELSESIDTIYSGLAANDFLVYNGTVWVNKTPTLALTTLGFSAFVKTLIDDADASTFLSTLGVSAFIKTLLDDADAAAARSTLGVDVFPPGMIAPYSARTAPTGWLLCDGSAVSRTTYANLFAAICPSLGTFTVTIASPAVFTLTAHGLQVGEKLRFTTTGALPTGLTANTDYFVSAIPTADTFRVSATLGGADVNTSGTQSGTHTAQLFAYGAGDGSTTFNVPDIRGRVIAGRDAMGGTSANRLTGLSAGVNGDTLGGVGGAETHTLTTAEIPAHVHSETAATTGGGEGGYGGVGTKLTVDSGSAGGGGAHNNVQPTIVTSYIIKT